MTDSAAFDLCNPTDEHRMLRELVAQFTRDEVEPQAEHHDQTGALNVELFRKLGELGLLGITVDASPINIIQGW